MDGALPRFLEAVMLLSCAFAMFVAPLTWLVFVLIPEFRLSVETHVLQVLAYVLCWILTGLSIALLESQPSPGWLLD